MKSIQLKDYSVGSIKATTKSLISNVIDFSCPDVITTSDQRKRIKLLDVLDAKYEQKTDVIEIEDADYTYLLNLIEGMKWGLSNSAVREFIKDFS